MNMFYDRGLRFNRNGHPYSAGVANNTGSQSLAVAVFNRENGTPNNASAKGEQPAVDFMDELNAERRELQRRFQQDEKRREEEFRAWRDKLYGR
jgi:hypothetical protein